MNADRLVEALKQQQADQMNASLQVQAFLMAIRACEGTAGPDGYRTLFGGKLFDDYSEHPFLSRPAIAFKQTDGTIAHTTAAGAYQFLKRTWEALRIRLSLKDFSPPNQDTAAIQLIADAGALGDVKDGRFGLAINKCSGIWASLPNSTYPQPRRTLQFASSAFVNAGGMLA